MNIVGRITGNDDIGYAVTVTDLETSLTTRSEARAYPIARAERDLLMTEMTETRNSAELAAVRVLHSPLSGPSARHDAEAELRVLGWSDLAIDLAYGREVWRTHDR